MEKWELAFEDYQLGMKYKDIASKYDVSINTVKSWKSRKWNDLSPVAPKEKGCTPKKKVANFREVPKAVVELSNDEELSEQHKNFCLLLIKYKYNQTKAYQEAFGCNYNSAKTNASRLIARTDIKKHVDALKLELRSKVFIDTQDIVKEYEAQYGADIKDYLKFGRKEIEVIDEVGNVTVKEVNYVDFNESNEVDGTLVKSVRMGKDGPVVELYDKQKAMDQLIKLLPKESSGSGNITIVDEWSGNDG